MLWQVDSTSGRSQQLVWQLTYAVDEAQLAEGWSKFWAGQSTQGRVDWGEVVKAGRIGLRDGGSWDQKKFKEMWAVVRGNLLLFYADEHEAGRAATAAAESQGGALGSAPGMAVQLCHLEVSFVGGGAGGTQVGSMLCAAVRACL